MTQVTHALGLAALGCAPAENTTELETWFDRFSGQWLVDQPYHAGYEATFYQMHEGGSLTMENSVWNTEPTGTVYNPDSNLSCRFGDRWHSPNSATLAIAGECDDAIAREIVLGFSADPANDSNDARAFVISVDGDPGWYHNQSEWRFFRPQ
jgi:hypothetical protein